MGAKQNVFDLNSSINVLPYEWTDIKDILRKANIRTLGEYIALGEDGLRKKKLKLGIVKMKKISDYLKNNDIDFSSFYISTKEKLEVGDSIYALSNNSNYGIRLKNTLYDSGIKTIGDFLQFGEKVVLEKQIVNKNNLSKFYNEIYKRLEKKEAN